MLEKLPFRFLYNCFHLDLKLTTFQTKQTHFWLREEVFQINIGIAAKYTGLKWLFVQMFKLSGIHGSL